jgi:hypothetical protein
MEAGSGNENRGLIGRFKESGLAKWLRRESIRSGAKPAETMSMQRDLKMAREGIDPERFVEPRRTMSMQTKIRSG